MLTSLILTTALWDNTTIIPSRAWENWGTGWLSNLPGGAGGEWQSQEGNP